jgi:two-component system NarL family response regulator
MRPKTIASPQQAKIRLLIADDHPVVRQGVIANVKPQRDMTVVAEASDGEEAISLIKKHLPDVVLLDLRMPRRDGLDVVAELKASKLTVKVVIMTTFDSEEDVRRAMKAGVRGYLLKDSTQEEILEAIRQVHAGNTYLPARILQRAADVLSQPELSPRETEVLRWVAAGKSNKEIGSQLFIAEGTAKTHVKSLLEKLGAASRTGAVREAVHRGLVRLD